MTTPVPTTRTADLTRDFNWGQVPTEQPTAADLAHPVVVPQINPPLGPLAKLADTTFRGNGFNTIFRPQNVALSPTHLLKTPDPADIDDNILELNVTEEILEFSSALGSVPNRGLVQGDITLNGVPYVQRVKDVTYPERPVDIHFEPGIWLNVPGTADPAEGATVVRMASIPHGTTIEAQGVSFVAPAPQIGPIPITPFFIGQPGNLLSFPSQDAGNNATFRIPQDLTTTTITKQMLDDPSTVLTDRIRNQTITTTTVILIDTNPASPLLGSPVDAALVGGGTDNMAFLKGSAGGPNADAVQMGAIFWVETIADSIDVPALQPGESVTVTGTDSAHDGLVPSFSVAATAAFAGGNVDVTYTQVQYSQLVHLNFGPLTWPHASVANLIPADPIPVSVP